MLGLQEPIQHTLPNTGENETQWGKPRMKSLCASQSSSTQFHASPPLLFLSHRGLEAYSLHFIDSLASYLPERNCQLGEQRVESNAICFVNFLLSAVHPAAIVAVASFRSSTGVTQIRGSSCFISFLLFLFSQHLCSQFSALDPCLGKISRIDSLF